jgi:hypothetical protein
MSALRKWFGAAAAVVTVTGSAAAQDVAAAGGRACPPQIYQVAPCPTPPGFPYQYGPVNGVPVTGAPAGTAPAVPEPSFSSTLAGAGAGETAAVGLGGYIDNAAPVTMFRLRYDAGYGNNRPDRAELFYAKCGCFQTRDAHGPPLPETNVDYQEVSAYFEYAVSPKLSFFTDVPVRFLNPEQNANTSGIGDVSFGAKYALVRCDDRILTLQMRAIAPSGSASQGLGTKNWWVEPGILWLEQVCPKWQVFGEVRDQIPVAKQSDFTGNVLRYGIGTSYIVAQNDRWYVAPVLETVGWTVLSGQEANESGAVSARGDTIVNLKLGLRFGFGGSGCGTAPTGSDLYIGYGRALTGEVWYKDLLRIEYRKFF